MDLPSEQEVVNLVRLEKVYDHFQQADAGSSVSAILRDEFESEFEIELWLRDRGADGTMDRGDTFESQWTLTDAGRARIELAKRRRADTSTVRRVLRDRLLAWTSNNSTNVGPANTPIRGFFLSPFGLYEGAPFDESLVNEIAGWLHDQGLLTRMVAGSNTLARVGVTHSGRDCAVDYDSDVSAWLAAQRHGGSTVNINALAVAIGEGATASVTQINPDAAATLGRALREALSTLDLGAMGEAAAEDLESRDEGRARRALNWLGGFANDTSSGALGSVLGTVALMVLGGG